MVFAWIILGTKNIQIFHINLLLRSKQNINVCMDLFSQIPINDQKMLKCSYYSVFIFFLNMSKHILLLRICLCKFCGWLNAKKRLAQNRCNIWKLTDLNRTRTNNHLHRQLTLNHLAKLDKCSFTKYMVVGLTTSWNL